jgi:hypothetical protein
MAIKHLLFQTILDRSIKQIFSCTDFTLGFSKTIWPGAQMGARHRDRPAVGRNLTLASAGDWRPNSDRDMSD